MKCQKCNQNNASVFYREIINGCERSIALCPACAERENASLPDPFFFSLFGVDSARRQVGSSQADKKCDLCGMTIAEITRTGRVGCARCYRIFEEELKAPLSELHGGRIHVGRGLAPKSEASQDSDGAKSELEKLRDELRQAIAAEEFERAAELRDAIKALEEDVR